jgi:hypothetical protein
VSSATGGALVHRPSTESMSLARLARLERLSRRRALFHSRSLAAA